MYFISALDPLSLILLNGILQLKSKRMITKCLSWRSQLKGIYENSRLMLIWQSRCRIPILRNCAALVYNNQSFSLSVSLFLSLLLFLLLPLSAFPHSNSILGLFSWRRVWCWTVCIFAWAFSRCHRGGGDCENDHTSHKTSLWGELGRVVLRQGR